MRARLAVYDTIDAELREACEDVVLNRPTKTGESATERLLEIAERFRDSGSREARTQDLSWREWPVEKRLEHARGQRHHRILSRPIRKRRALLPSARCM
ncbi:hypothetical protein VXQ18_07490 [Brucella abortus]|nr:hypothetical protein [Brucella abortus]